jgi:hypothetical protein
MTAFTAGSAFADALQGMLLDLPFVVLQERRHALTLVQRGSGRFPLAGGSHILGKCVAGRVALEPVDADSVWACTRVARAKIKIARRGSILVKYFSIDSQTPEPTIMAKSE